MNSTPTISELRAMTVPERLAAFVAWLGTQDPATPYRFRDIHDCALCKFGNASARRSYPKWWPVVVGAGGRYFKWMRWWGGIEEMLIFLHPTNGITPLVHSATLAELHGRLLPLVAPAGPTEAELDRVELRPLAGSDVQRKAGYGTTPAAALGGDDFKAVE